LLAHIADSSVRWACSHSLANYINPHVSVHSAGQGYGRMHPTSTTGQHGHSAVLASGGAAALKVVCAQVGSCLRARSSVVHAVPTYDSRERASTRRHAAGWFAAGWVPAKTYFKIYVCHAERHLTRRWWCSKQGLQRQVKDVVAKGSLELVVNVGLLALSHVTRLTPPVAACLSTSVRGFGLNMTAFLPHYDEMHRRQTR
jgi:hypothetical protein